MKQTLKNLLCLAVLASSTAAFACDSSGSCGVASGSGSESDCCFPGSYSLNANGNVYGQTNFTAHPVQWDQFRRMSGASTEKLHLFGEEEFYGVASLALQYQQTTGNSNIAQWFSFAKGNSSNNGASNGQMSYGIESDGTNDISALNFGVTSSGIVSFCPKIQNFVADIDLFFGWDEFVCGLWSRFSIPINWTRWNLGLHDTNNGGGLPNYPGANSISVALNSSAAVPVAYTNMKDAWNGDKTFGDVPVLKKGRINGSQDKVAVAGLKMELGYDFMRREKSHLALSLMVVAPTGNKPEATFLFDAISGSSKSWEIGGDINGHWNFWEKQECNQSLGLHFDVALMGQLKASQTRLFGLNSGGVNSTATPAANSCTNLNAGSSWLLLKKFTGGATPTSVVGLERAANILALESKIGAGFETNGAILVKYIRNHFSFDLGYELYYRNAETLTSRNAIAAQTYAVYGVSTTSNSTDVHSQSTSSIGSVGANDTTFTYLADSDVCNCSALQPSTFSNKVFGFAEYSWDNCDWEPTLGLGASYEIGADKQGAENVALNQWSVLAKGSISF